MQLLRNFGIHFLKIFIFWFIIFDIQRIIFSIHNYEKLAGVSWFEFFQVFFQSIQLDLASTAFLSFVPLFFLVIHYLYPVKWTALLFKIIIIIELIYVCLIHAGEINAYPEWNHKLTSRVFTHLANPDEVARTADYSMTIWFTIYAIIELVIGYLLMKRLFKFDLKIAKNKVFQRIFIVIPSFAVSVGTCIVFARGGFQQIPINYDAACFSKHYVVNDISINSTYFFSKSFMLYMRSNTGVKFPLLKDEDAKANLSDFYQVENDSTLQLFDQKNPNIIFILLESWSANAVGSITKQKGATPNFDKLAKEGVLFTNIYSTASTSEVGNSSIFSGYPAIPEVFISMQLDKNRKIPSINQDLKKRGYTSQYIFSGDLKYGNIGSYFKEHGFDVVEDENDFPPIKKRGKLNFYDEDLYKVFLKKINQTKQPFMHCAFTGSTHSPYDFPMGKTPVWKGAEAKFMSSMYYADQCLYDFIQKSKKEAWYKNTIFVLVADHGHAAPNATDPSSSKFYHIPLLFYGEPLKKEHRGKIIDHLGSQADIAKTLLNQLGYETSHYHWSKDLLNKNSPQFALHTIQRGYGWVSPKGNFTYQMDMKLYLEQTFSNDDLKNEAKRCFSFMSLIYHEYQKL